MSGRRRFPVEQNNSGRAAVAAKRQAPDQRRGFYSRKLLHLLDHLAMKIPSRVGLGVLRAGQTVFQSEQVLRFETDTGLQQLAEAADEQTGGNQKQDGEGDLRDDETTAHPVPASAAAGAASAFFQSSLHL